MSNGLLVYPTREKTHNSYQEAWKCTSKSFTPRLLPFDIVVVIVIRRKEVPELTIYMDTMCSLQGFSNSASCCKHEASEIHNHSEKLQYRPRIDLGHRQFDLPENSFIALVMWATSRSPPLTWETLVHRVATCTYIISTFATISRNRKVARCAVVGSVGKISDPRKMDCEQGSCTHSPGGSSTSQ